MCRSTVDSVGAFSRPTRARRGGGPLPLVPQGLFRLQPLPFVCKRMGLDIVFYVLDPASWALSSLEEMGEDRALFGAVRPSLPLSDAAV